MTWALKLLEDLDVKHHKLDCDLKSLDAQVASMKSLDREISENSKPITEIHQGYFYDPFKNKKRIDLGATTDVNRAQYS